MGIRGSIRRSVVWASLLVAALLAVTLFINLSWFDETLHPDLASPDSPHPVSMNDNAFPLLHGFTAAADKDQLVVGQAIVQTMRERYRRGEKATLTEEEMDDLLGRSGNDDDWRTQIQSLYCNSRVSVDCAGPLINELEQFNADNPRLLVLLKRYDEILRAPRFLESEEVDVTTLIPTYALLMQVARMRLAISYRQDTVEDYIAKVGDDMRFWRTMLRDGQTMIAKMVALAGFRNSMEFLSALIRLRDLSESELQSIRNTLYPLTDDELDIGESFLAELRIMALNNTSVIDILGDDGRALRPFFQERATLNEYYARAVIPLRVRATLPAEEFYAQRGFDRLTYEFRLFPPPLYNLGGKLALKRLSSQQLPQDRISRMHDVNGRVSLVLLQVEIEESDESSVENVLRSSTHRNPYTGEPIEYDPSAKTIGFECLTENPNDVCSVSIRNAGD